MKSDVLFCITKKPVSKNFKAINFILILLIGFCQPTFSQCPGGYYRNTVKWDNLDYLSTGGNYSGYVTNAMSETQKFAIGVNYLTITRSSAITTTGEESGHTGEANSYGTGEDVAFAGDGTITLTFNNEVQNVQFSLYDIDQLQTVTVTAVNNVSVGQTVTLTSPAGTILTITGSPGLSPTGYDAAPSTSVAKTSNTATLNVSVAGPVKTITITISTSGATKDFWLSDISACVSGTFSNNYLTQMQPFTGQPTFILATGDTNTVSFVNIATGVAKKLFQDVSCSYINSMAYDPVKHELYYVIDFTSSPSTNKAIKKYNFETQTISTVISDITTLGLPTFERGMESAGSSFYDGELYIGIEGIKSGHSGNRETIIWRISFNGGGTPINACQVYGTPSDNGAGTNLHDWNDFAVVDSMLIDFNGAASSFARYTHLNMNTGVIDNSYTTGNIWNRPRQTGLTWDKKIYWVHDSIALYNGNGTIGSRTKITGATVLDWTGYAGDASAFRPPSDFGDAPASYDPVALSPAINMKDTALRLGPTFDEEFSKFVSANADGDGSDEDGILTVNLLDTALSNYFADIKVYNNSGSNATLIGWLDINGNGTFESTEAISAVVPHGGAVLQNVRLTWIAINTPLGEGLKTFLRIRLTSASNGMTVSNPTGYYSNGEVEDYPVFIAAVLPVQLISFDAKAENNKSVKNFWHTENEINISRYEVQKSRDGSIWQTFNSLAAGNQGRSKYYEISDNSPSGGRSFYRLKMIDFSGNFHFSRTVSLYIEYKKINISLYPNPINQSTQLMIRTDESPDVELKIFNAAGFTVQTRKVHLSTGENHIPFAAAEFPAGIYILQMETIQGIRQLRFIKKSLN